MIPETTNNFVGFRGNTLSYIYNSQFIEFNYRAMTWIILN